jgi:thiamine biosynthesis protein ThiI
VKYDLIIIRYGEIALKSKYTRNQFENKLINNTKKIFKKNNINYDISKEWGRIYLKTDNIEESIKILKNIFGIVSISPAIKIETNIEEITKKSLSITKNKLSKKNSFALRVNRVGKHNFTSIDVANIVGKEIVLNTKSNVKLKSPDYEIFIDIRNEHTYIFLEKIYGRGGMPIGTQGNILIIINKKKSILAAWYLIRRGCNPVFYLKNNLQKNNLNKFMKKWFIDAKIYEKNQEIKEIIEIKKIIKNENCQSIVTEHTIETNDEIITNIKQIKNSYGITVLTPLIMMEQKNINKNLKEIGL